MAIVYGSWAFTLFLMFACSFLLDIPMLICLTFWSFFWVGIVILCKAFDYYERKHAQWLDLD